MLDIVPAMFNYRRRDFHAFARERHLGAEVTGRILIADDHPLTREGLAMAARLAVPGVVIDAVGSIGEAEAVFDRGLRYRLILLDLVLPDSKGFSGMLRLQFAAPDTPVAIITAREDPRLADIARSLGAAAFLRKSEALDTLAQQIRRVAAGELLFVDLVPPGPGSDVRNRIADLSDAQRRVLFAMQRGASNKEIGATLDITEATVKAHMTAIFRQLGVTNRAQALIALQPLLGDVAPEDGL